MASTGRRRGRPAIGPRISVNVSADLRADIAREAKARGTTHADEIRRRLAAFAR